jgi:hypothetical protein
MHMTQRVTQGRTMMLDGSHLFPMEQPLATAAAIEASVLNLQSLGDMGGGKANQRPAG